MFFLALYNVMHSPKHVASTGGVMNDLTKARQRKGWTQMQLAHKCANAGIGVTQSDISSYESGAKVPTLRRALHLALILDLIDRPCYSRLSRAFL